MAAIAAELAAPFGASFSTNWLINLKFCHCVRVKLSCAVCLACMVDARLAAIKFSRMHVGRGGGYAGAVYKHFDIHNKLTRTASATFYVQSIVS